MDNNFVLLNNAKKTYWYLNKTLENVPKKEVVLKTHVDEYMLVVIKETYLYLINKDSHKLRKNNLKNIIINLELVDFFTLEIYNRKYISKKKFTSICNHILQLRKITYGVLRHESSIQ